MKTILVYHQSAEVRQNLKDILTNAGYQVLSPEEIIEAINHYAAKNLDLIIAEPQFLTYLSRQSQPLRAPFVALLDRTDARLAVELLQNGARECLSPPYRQVEVVGTVQYLLGEEPRKIKKPITVPFWLPFIGGLFLLGLWWFFGKQPAVQIIDLPYDEPTAILADRNFIWISDWYTQSIYQYEQPVLERYFRLSTVNHFSDFGPVALAKKDDVLYSIGNDGILRRHSGDEHSVPEIVADLKITGVTGMCFADDYLWVVTNNPAKLYQFNTSSFNPGREWNCSDIQPIGLEKVNDGFLTLDTFSRRVVLVNPEGNELVLKKNCSSRILILSGRITAFARLKKRAFVTILVSPKHSKLFCFNIRI